MVDRGNRERGLKAAIHNPRVSEQAKQRDREILEAEFGEHFEEVLPKSTHSQHLSSPGEESEEYVQSPPLRAKPTTGLAVSTGQSTTSKTSSSGTAEDSSNAKPKIRRASVGAAGTKSSTQEDSIDGKDSGNVIRGLKAAIRNPNVSEKAKEKDRQKLRNLGESVD